MGKKMTKLSIFLIISSYACVSTAPAPTPIKPTSTVAKPTPSDPAKMGPQSKRSTPSSPMDKILQGLNDNLYTYLVQFGESVSKTNTLQAIDFSISQDEILAAISGAENQTEMNRAILTLSILAQTSNAIAQSKTAEDTQSKEGLYSDQAGQGESRVLESLSSDYEIHIGEELATNPFLKSFDLHHFAILTIVASDASQDFKAQHLKKIQLAKFGSDRNQQKIEAWLKSGTLLLTSPIKEEDLSSTPSVVATPINGDVRNSPPSDSGLVPDSVPGSEPGLDATLNPPTPLEAPSVTRARELSLLGNFKGSVEMLSRIPANSPEYPEAQSQLKITSNTAVQELRRKAAAAYQNSLPVSDIETRKSYLNEAKKHLEVALRDFPAADLKSTVKDNLERIQTQLNELERPGR